MPTSISLVINSIGLASNTHALRIINSPAFANPQFLGFGGQYQYLTIIGLVASTLALALKIIRHFIPNFSPGLYAAVNNIATPMEGLISVLYWSMMLLDPHLLIPKDYPGIPLMVDMSLHLFPAVVLWIDFLAFDLQFRRSDSHVKMIGAFTVFYFIWSWYCKSVNGFWAYPFLADFNLFMRIGFFAGSGFLCWGMYELGAKLHAKIHGVLLRPKESYLMQ